MGLLAALILVAKSIFDPKKENEKRAGKLQLTCHEGHGRAERNDFGSPGG